MPCPHCHRNAPIVYKGVFAYCSACNQPRAPFSGMALSLAGQPSKWGGRVGSVVGFLVLFSGWLLAAALMLFFQLLLPARMVGYAVGLPIILLSTVFGVILLIVGGRLKRSGSETERLARIEALYGLAVRRAGTLTVADAARSLQLDRTQVDALLTDLAKTQPEHVALELDDEGQPFYVFTHEGIRPHPFGARYRVSNEGTVRVTDVLGVDDPANQAPVKRSQS